MGGWARGGLWESSSSCLFLFGELFAATCLQTLRFRGPQALETGRIQTRGLAKSPPQRHPRAQPPTCAFGPSTRTLVRQPAACNALSECLHASTTQRWPTIILCCQLWWPDPRIASFSEEGTFAPGFGRFLIGKASKAALRPAFGRPEGLFSGFSDWDPAKTRRKNAFPTKTCYPGP